MYEWKTTQKQRIEVYFFRANPAITYCTISVTEKDGKIYHYHGGTVCSPVDKWNGRTGEFNAFKEALHRRWASNFFDYSNDFHYSWQEYHKYWSHFLSALIDGKVENGYDTPEF